MRYLSNLPGALEAVRVEVLARLEGNCICTQVAAIAHVRTPLNVKIAARIRLYRQADDYYSNGQTCPRNQPVTGTSDPALFAVERYGHFDYSIPVDVRGRFTVSLHFAEFYFGPSAPGKGGLGSRVFDVTCNGIMLLENLDIFKEAGTARALTKVAYHIKPSAQGRLNLTFEPVVNYALIYGIEVFDESE